MSTTRNPGESTTPSRIWLWVVAAFLIQIAVWAAWFTIASQHKVKEVPLATMR